MTIEVSAKILSPPPMCACCGCPTQSYQSVAAEKERSQQQWLFPCCDQCLHHGEMWKPTLTIAEQSSAAGLTAALLGWLIFGLSGVAFGVVMFVAIAALGYRRQQRARALRTQTCSNCELPVVYLGYYGSIHSFQFSSQFYAVAFARANQKKLVNVEPALQRLLVEESPRIGGVP